MIHLGKNTRTTIISKGISAGQSNNSYRGLVKIMPKARRRAQLHAVRFDADRRPVRREHVSVYRSDEQHAAGRARSVDFEDQRRAAVLFAQRGISQEDAVSLIINGFCKDVFRELPMEFAVEATKLLGLKLEGSVG